LKIFCILMVGLSTRRDVQVKLEICQLFVLNGEKWKLRVIQIVCC
jgi:hypothetical protein